MSGVIILLWVLVPTALFLAVALSVASIGVRTKNADLRKKTTAPEKPDGWSGLLLNVRGLNGSCDMTSGRRGVDR